MYKSERHEQIMQIVRRFSYVTVKYLTATLDYSVATLNRDLNELENQGIIKRSYGGVSLTESAVPPLPFRYHKLESIKSKLGQTASDVVCDGDTVFIDGTTTTQAIGKYLISKKNIKVITSNIALFLYLNEHGVDTLLLGGGTVEPPYFLGGRDTESNAMSYHADKMFFSASRMTADGKIEADAEYETLRRIMANNSKEIYFLADNEKVSEKIDKVLFTFNEITGVISNYAFSNSVIKAFPSTKFINVV